MFTYSASVYRPCTHEDYTNYTHHVLSFVLERLTMLDGICDKSKDI